MTAITTRAGKGSTLTWNEVDANFTNLNTDKAETDSPTFTGTVSGITKAMVGLGNVDNTSDVNKPVSIAQQTAIDSAVSTGISTHVGLADPHPQYTQDTQLAASNGSSLVGFIQSGAGAITRTTQDKSRDIVSVKDFGAVGNGVVDDSAAMQAAHNTGKLVYYPAGTYLFSPTITIASGGISGDGPTQTILKSNDVGASNLIKYTGSLGSYTNVPLFRDFTLLGNISKTAGAGIQVFPTTGESSYLDFSNVHFAYCPIGIDFVAASLWKVIGCNFLAYTIAGIQVANTNSPDSGDSVISSCMFNNPYTIGSGIWQKSSGGLKIVGNKFLGGFRGYTMNLEGSTSVLLIAGNSFENMVGQDIVFSQGVAGKTFVNVAITGNEFSVGGIAISTDPSNFLSEVVITSNNINMGAGGSNDCISLVTVTDFYIGGNIIKGNGGVGSSAINLTSCVNGKIGLNTYANLPTPIVITTSPTVTYALDSQSGSSTTSTTGWTGYGSLFVSSETTVTFNRPFLMQPSITDITITAGSSNGSITGFVTSLTKSGFTYKAISSVTGIAATIYWKVSGVL